MFNYIRMSNNDFKSIMDFTLYEINKHGVVRRKTTEKEITNTNGVVKLLADEEEKRMNRSVKQLVQQTFFPELNSSRNAIRYIKDVGYIKDETNQNGEEQLISKLIHRSCDYKIRARKNYKDDLRFWFVGLMEQDEKAKCLIVNDDDDTITLYQDEDEARDNINFGDCIYYFNVFNGKGELSNNSELLEHVIMSKFYYMKYIIEEQDIDTNINKLYKKYFNYDFEEKYDDWCDELGRQVAEKETLPENKVVKIHNGMRGLPQLTDEQLDIYHKDKERDVARRHESLRQQQFAADAREEQAMRMAQEACNNKLSVAENKLIGTIGYYNQKHNTSYYDLDSMVRGFRTDIKKNKQKREAEERKKLKDEAKKAKMTQELNLLHHQSPPK